MKHSSLRDATKISYSNEAEKALEKLHVTHQAIEEVFFNFPTVKKLSVQFSDTHERFLVEGVTDFGKRFVVVFFIQRHAIHITYIKKGGR